MAKRRWEGVFARFLLSKTTGAEKKGRGATSAVCTMVGRGAILLTPLQNHFPLRGSKTGKDRPLVLPSGNVKSALDFPTPENFATQTPLGRLRTQKGRRTREWVFFFGGRRRSQRECR